jgi:hypothetical protein
VIALDEDRVADLRRERRLESVELLVVQELDAEFLDVGPGADVAPALGRRRRVDRSARDVLDVDPGAHL